MKLKTEVLDSKISVQNEILNKDYGSSRADHTDYEYEAKISIDGNVKGQLLRGAFTFFDKNGEFNGIDRGFFELSGAPFSEPYFVDMSVSIPKGTVSVECVLDCSPDKLETWQKFAYAGAVLVLLILASLLIRIWI